MSEIADLLSDVLSDSPTKKGEKSHNSPFFAHSENGMDKGFSPNSPDSPRGDEFLIRPEQISVSLPHVINESDDRNKCSDCVHLSVRGYCGKWKATNPHNERYMPVRDVLHRCGSFRR